MNDFTRLVVWRRARALTAWLYDVSSAFPDSEMFGITSQLRQAAVSVGANLAEGAGRPARAFARFVANALGSLNELERLLFIADDLCYLNGRTLPELRGEVGEIRAMSVQLRRALLRAQ